MQQTESASLRQSAADFEEQSVPDPEVAAEPAVSDLNMERGAMPELRELSGTITDAVGNAIVGAQVFEEDKGAVVLTDLHGEFRLSVASDVAPVLVVAVANVDTLRFDASGADEFNVRVPPPHSVAQVHTRGTHHQVPIVYPRATRNPAFDLYASQQRDVADSVGVVLQFIVSRDGRPRQITTGPGSQDRTRFRQAKELLLNGPRWPEPYRKMGWRYTIYVGK